MEGFGRYVFATGKAYEGQFSNDLKDGYGVFKWPDGRIYAGWWQEGK